MNDTNPTTAVSEEPTQSPGEPQAPPAQAASSAVIEQDEVVKALKTVKDPELHVNVIDLGLVYSIQTHAGGALDVEMTLTSPACPAGPQILRDAVAALEKIEGVSKANVRLVMSPPWTPDRMSDAARDELGIF